MNLNDTTTMLRADEDTRKETVQREVRTEAGLEVLDDAFLAYVGGGTGIGNMQ